MQIPAGDGRQGSAEKMTDGEWLHPVARHGPAAQFKSMAQIHTRLFCGQRNDSSRLSIVGGAYQGLFFDASFAADITPPVICLICSPAFVN
jgi:hypothetical protein